MKSGPGNGGAIYSSNSLTVLNCSFLNNKAIGGPAHYWPPFVARDLGGNAYGGAVYLEGANAGFTNATFFQNTALGADGVYGATGGDAAGGTIYSPVRFAFAGEAGQTYAVQASTNLTDWTSYSTNTIPSSGVLEIQLDNASDPMGVFFRSQKQ
ncbi:MAG: hypothetical protein M1608_12645 [Candidatus Omnitrophica bacterium]|nr:hypothetical protein [Candidatus Omnitrophota bacterium]